MLYAVEPTVADSPRAYGYECARKYQLGGAEPRVGVGLDFAFYSYGFRQRDGVARSVGVVGYYVGVVGRLRVCAGRHTGGKDKCNKFSYHRLQR